MPCSMQKLLSIKKMLAKKKKKKNTGKQGKNYVNAIASNHESKTIIDSCNCKS